MNSTKIIHEIIGIIFALLAIITGVVTIILIIIKLTGNSPDIITISLWTASLVVTLIMVGINALLPIKEDIGRLKEFQRQTSHGFTILEDNYKSYIANCLQ